MLVKYTGRKQQYPINFPIGEKRKSAWQRTIMVTPGEEVELTEYEAKELLKIDWCFTEAKQTTKKPKKVDNGND